MLHGAIDNEVLGGASFKLQPEDFEDSVNQASKLANDIISRLDAKSILELSGGSESDVLRLFDNIYEESLSLITQKGKKTQVHASALEYLDALSENIDREFKYEDINYFVSTVFPDFDIDWHILEWGHFAMFWRALCLLAARGRGKSFYFSYALPLWKMYRYQKDELHMPAISKSRQFCKEGLIITATESLGIEFLGYIKDAIQDNPFLNERLYPQNGSGFNQKSIKTRNGARLEVKGFDTNLRGKHPTYLICDDMLTENQLYSAEARHKAIEKFKGTVLKLPIDGGQIIIVGTPFHENDLYSKLKEFRGWMVLKYPALYPDGTLLAPNRFKFQNLQMDREYLGATFFSRELLCVPTSGASTIFPYEIVRRSVLGMENDTLVHNASSVNSKYKFKKIVMGCDLAMSANTKADYSVFITMGLTENDERVLLNVWRGHGKTLSEQKAKIKSLYDEFGHDLILIESNQFQAVVPQQLKEEYQGIPVEGYQTTARKNLASGVPSLTILFERYKYKFPYGDEESRAIVDTMFTELSSMAYTEKGLQGAGSHDDTVMALWLSEVAILKDVAFSFAFI